MSYRSQNFTLIDDLPMLDDLEMQDNAGGMSYIPNDKRGTVQKFIRNNNYNPPSESGMKEQIVPPAPIQIPQPEQHIQQIVPYQITDDDINRLKQHQSQSINVSPPQYMYNNEPNCVSVAEHTHTCIVCSRLYKDDSSSYVVVIILLSIICILLLKRVLNV